VSTKDPELVTQAFNECINAQDIEGLARLMTDDHTFIDRNGTVHQPKAFMIDCWRRFFAMFPRYKNTFTRMESNGDRVVILGYAYWSEAQPHDGVIWTATIVNELVREWSIYEDTAENRRRFLINPAPT
jgi:predicted SnoaL-like aldol condensation-catalyzing enzyme